MDFTREPIIETVITPRDGYKIVVRSSKAIGQEEYFVDAVEIVSFGNSHFFRSLERPKPFIVPVSDYEVVETREARIVLKNVGLDRSIKIAGGKEPKVASKENPSKESAPREALSKDDQAKDDKKESDTLDVKSDSKPEAKVRRERRRGRGRRRGDSPEAATVQEDKLDERTDSISEDKVDLETPKLTGEKADKEGERISDSVLSELLTPPPALISETLSRYRDNALFQSAFYTKEELDEVDIPEVSSLDSFKEGSQKGFEESPVLEAKVENEEINESFEVSLSEDFVPTTNSEEDNRNQ